MKILPSLEKLREIEAAALAEHLPLMERAGQNAAALILRRYPGVCRVLVLCGPGNNGGDGLVCARFLQESGLDTACWFLQAPDYHGDAAQAYSRWQSSGGSAASMPDFASYDLVVDALFGIGFSRPLDERSQTLIRQLNASGKPAVALDVPSGLNAFSGSCPNVAVRADCTLTFLTDKPGLHTGEGCDHAGRVELATLGLNARQLSAALSLTADGELIDSRPDSLARLCRPANSHKGLFGSVAIFGGASGMLGAPLLAARAALKLGAGKVRLGFLADNHPALDLLQPELMLHSAHELLNHADKTLLVIGPGLGQEDAARDILGQLLPLQLPLILDADALNLLAKSPDLQEPLRQRRMPSIITPHPAEAARLLGCSGRQIQADRIGAAQELARAFNSIVLLKGAGSIICEGSHWRINGSGNAALSNAGQGDALCSILAALLAQGIAPFEATSAAAWLHGAAADLWKERNPLGIGLTASEVIDLARERLNQPGNLTFRN